jgi:hypothetical protein
VHVTKFKLADKKGALIELLKYSKDAEQAKAAPTPEKAPRVQNVRSVEEWRVKYGTAAAK